MSLMFIVQREILMMTENWLQHQTKQILMHKMIRHHIGIIIQCIWQDLGIILSREGQGLV